MCTLQIRTQIRPLLSLALCLALPLLIISDITIAAPKDGDRWDRKYSEDKFLFGKEPIPFLRDNLSLLPKGTALDIAMGEGRNGVFLATKGFQVTGLDISERGLEKARQLATAHGVSITTQVVDLETHHLEKNAYDVVLCTYYLQRDLFPQMKDALRSGGMAVVETYTLDHQKYRPRFRTEYLIRQNELLDIFKDFIILRYQTVDDGKSAYASIIAQKP